MIHMIEMHGASLFLCTDSMLKYSMPWHLLTEKGLDDEARSMSVVPYSLSYIILSHCHSMTCCKAANRSSRQELHRKLTHRRHRHASEHGLSTREWSDQTHRYKQKLPKLLTNGKSKHQTTRDTVEIGRRPWKCKNLQWVTLCTDY